VFRTAAAVAAAAFLLSWLLPEVKLRKTVAATDPGDTFGMPADRSSAQALERAASVLARREDRVVVYRRIAARAGLPALRPAACCLLSRIGREPGIRLADLAARTGTAATSLGPIVAELAAHGLVAVQPEHSASTSALVLTETGRTALERLRAARAEDLADLLDGWSPDRHAELRCRLRGLACDLIDTDTPRLRSDDHLRTAA
jgi:DNA-binding MarR family transcriptional regulator